LTGGSNDENHHAAEPPRPATRTSRMATDVRSVLARSQSRNFRRDIDTAYIVGFSAVTVDDRWGR
jgi:hypothetical protein